LDFGHARLCRLFATAKERKGSRHLRAGARDAVAESRRNESNLRRTIKSAELYPPS
jgi:hypothetical protein